MAAKSKAADQDRSATTASGPDLAALYKSVSKESKIEIMVAADLTPTAWLSTGLPLLDVALGGGIPRGRLTHIWGDSSSGKSALGLWLVRRQQELFPGSAVFYIDTELAVATEFANKLGVDTKTLGMPKKPTALTVEDTFAFAACAIERAAAAGFSGDHIVVIWDSLAATVTNNELSGDFDNTKMAALAAAVSRGLKKLRPIVVDAGATFVMLNQGRAAMNAGYGGPQKAPCGGAAPIYYSDLSVKLKKCTEFKSDDNNPYGVQVEAKVEKSRVGLMGRKSKFHIYFINGLLTDLPEFYDALKTYKLARNSGPTVVVNEEPFQNKQAFINKMKSDPPYTMMLTSMLKEAMSVSPIVDDVEGVMSGAANASDDFDYKSSAAAEGLTDEV